MGLPLRKMARPKRLSLLGRTRVALFGKIQDGEVSIEFAGGAIIGLSGGKLIAKIADLLSLAIHQNLGTRFLPVFVVPDTSVS
jgi:hypothetical protein